MNLIQGIGIAAVGTAAPLVQKYLIQPLLRRLAALPNGTLKRVLLFKIGK